MIYLYAYSNHRSDLDSLRRVGALWKALQAQGQNAEILVNDYRAQLAGRELGLPSATTIETVVDIDAVAEFGDRVLIDSPEELPESRLERFTQRFERLCLVRPCGGEVRFGERILDPWGEEGPVVDPAYVEAEGERNDRRVLIYGDSDYDKRLLQASEALGRFGFELYWGSYFYVKYEEELMRHFPVIHESEEYSTLIKESGTVVTAMPQTAAEAALAGVRSIWLDRGESPDCIAPALERCGVQRVEWESWNSLSDALENPRERSCFRSALPSWIEALLG